MKIFISWSGKLSQELGNALKEWIPDVLQAVQCYFTPEDIQKGDRWSSEIAKELEESMFGIFCVTSENLNSGWMHFEAGAISKSKDGAQVCPILFDLRPTDLTGPLQQFQATVFSEEDMLKLMKAINAKLDTQAIAEDRLTRQFSLCWPRLQESINTILSSRKTTSKKPARSERELIEEILTIVREGQRTEKVDSDIYSKQQNLFPYSQFAPLEHILNIYIMLVTELKNDFPSNQKIMDALAEMKRPLVFLMRRHENNNKIRQMLQKINEFEFKAAELPF